MALIEGFASHEQMQVRFSRRGAGVVDADGISAPRDKRERRGFGNSRAVIAFDFLHFYLIPLIDNQLLVQPEADFTASDSAATISSIGV